MGQKISIIGLEDYSVDDDDEDPFSEEEGEEDGEMDLEEDEDPIGTEDD